MRAIISILVVCVFLLSYQNCAKVELSMETETYSSYVAKTGGICIPEGYSLQSFYVANLNAIMKNSRLQADSDMDGLTDLEEVEIGFDPRVRRSRGKGMFLDGVVVQKGGITDNLEELVCDPESFNSMSLGDCDVTALGLASSSDKDKGIDSDHDGFLDLIEILRGTVVYDKDAELDPDQDGKTNHQELLIGSSPTESDEYISEDQQIHYTLSRSRDSVCGSGVFWEISIEQIPTVKTLEYFEASTKLLPGQLPVQHMENENIILYSYKIVADDPTKSAELYAHWEKHLFEQIDHSTMKILTTSDFTKVGEVAK